MPDLQKPFLQVSGLLAWATTQRMYPNANTELPARDDLDLMGAEDPNPLSSLREVNRAPDPGKPFVQVRGLSA
jgi:hypothetical protein